MKEDAPIGRRLLVGAAVAAPFFVAGWLLIPREGGWGAMATSSRLNTGKRGWKY
jgi:hypothetical protein